jgi:hypothetical protein
MIRVIRRLLRLNRPLWQLEVDGVVDTMLHFRTRRDARRAQRQFLKGSSKFPVRVVRAWLVRRVATRLA